MIAQVSRLPFFVVLMGLGAVSMLLPAAHGLTLGDYTTMRVYFYGAILFGILTLLIGLATAGFSPANIVRSQLITLLAAFTILPVLFAIPFYEALQDESFLDAWFEMISSFTTTGATLYDNVGDLTPSLHLWRALVGWMGGFLVWVTALAIMAPMNLGGFEVRAVGQMGPVSGNTDPFGERTSASERLAGYAAKLLPIYAGLTLLLWLGLIAAGDVPYLALIHAMSTLSTSGISAIGGLFFTASAFWGELLIFLFLAFAVSRLTFSSGLRREAEGLDFWRDPEVRVAAFLIISVSGLLVLRHFVGAVASEGATFGDLLRASWGALFTVASFLTTTGFESRFWIETAAWTGLQSPGIFLLGLAMIGGGVATTAGGAKLLRVYALYRHSEREMARLLHPSSVGGGGKTARQIRKQGAYISWVFFMLLALSIMVVMLLLSLTGVQFETSMILSVAALSTTGPLASVAGEVPIAYSGLPDAAKIILAAAMVLGRLETLAIIALFNPDFWRS